MSSDVRPVLHVLGFSRWKRRLIPAFLPEYELCCIESFAEVPVGGRVLVWGAAEIPEGFDGEVWRLEDGFLRSVGLGADLIRPVSWVLDRSGIHYDSSRVSDLECLLQAEVFDDDLLARAAALRGRLVQAGLTKYNLAGPTWLRPVGGQRVVLVVGQVESDASLAFGSPVLRTNMGLLRAVRERCPDAFVVYKPHPDVIARLRASGEGEREAASLCDLVLPRADMATLFDQVDEVHVLTSLAGFEALLRGRRVVCYGLPFYAGWGLTEDRLVIPRRQRRLTLDELAAGVLIRYPRYLSMRSGRLLEVEDALDELLQRRASSGRWGALGRFVLECRRIVLRQVVGVR